MKKTAFWLVSLQLTLIAAIIVVMFLTGRWSAWSVGFWLASMLVFGSAFVSLGRSLTISPIPNNRGLRKGGIYRYIRHPMYLAVALFGIGATAQAIWALIPFLMLCAILALKVYYEEKLLLETYPEYRQYQEQTKRLIPFIW